MKSIFQTVLLALLAASLGSTLVAQTPGRAQLFIKVTDASGALVPDAEVVLVRGNDERKITTGTSGTAEVSGLTIGEWTMTVRREGFTPRQRPVVVGDTLVNATVTL